MAALGNLTASLIGAVLCEGPKVAEAIDNTLALAAVRVAREGGLDGRTVNDVRRASRHAAQTLLDIAVADTTPR